MTGVIVAGLAERNTVPLVFTVAIGAKRCCTTATADSRTDAAFTAICGGAEDVFAFLVPRIATRTRSPVVISVVRPFGTPIVP